MQFTTPVPVPLIPKKITHDSLVFLGGSCFAESMAQKLEYFQFRTITNPFGILFNPLVLLDLFELADSSNEKAFDVFEQHGKWHYFGSHSKLSNTDRSQLELSLQRAVRETKKALESASHFIFTLGTAWVYRHLTSGKIVANCHKVPQQQFEKVLLSPTEVYESVRKLSAIISKWNPSAVQIFTISPVRHIKDGIVGNQRSKANLISGLHSFMEESENQDIVYFPSYEIVLDELRDYRFFATDMLHPSDMAIDYIWERFSQSIMTAETTEVMGNVSFIRKASEHRPFDLNSDSYKRHLELIDKRISALQLQFPHMEF
ncbi:GSCFA domain-containing protein [Flavobacterium silvaticum]|uniref:GSCFA domain-containing protein n=1 Tax=Flavobacterium silvaticum TaxID=1852020 RepID=A0A972FJC2_9FLAO|nr:GSCFA domain-containing protein [Flavobacterium silvaticum]NMH26732.1 GSCFA domain-containing protein [Flavobacterium silvaticum]